MTKYGLSARDRILPHGKHVDRLLHDISDHPRSKQIEALVASGDCFITLATDLDNLTEPQKADAAKPNYYAEVEKLITTLLYLQQHYKIIRKKADYRQ